ncbi:L-proline dehydrogenase [Belliella pelovolcani]|uniref:L-proline dehydrogenase n=2 Tax=Belliella pelovolcani TaxID=529505 RepID=A0A1N7L999_9BACT|nr:proline dehydrogenase family protein [Belliella pelovolcani]SIS70414.1 L-proline dehydrogenase [Belliella pelovolcani]
MIHKVYLQLELQNMPTKTKISLENLEVAFASKSDADLRKMYLIFATMNSNTAVKMGIKMANLAFKIKFPIKGLMKSTMFGHFCGGESIEDSQQTVDELAAFNIKTILDYSVEGEGNEDSYEATYKEILRTIERSAGDDNIPFAVFKVTGLGDYKIMIKVQEGKMLNNAERASFDKLKARVDGLCQAAAEANTRILIDAEESWFQDVIDQMVYEAMEKYNQKDCIVYNTYQMYRHDMLQRLKDANEVAESKGYKLGAKLVRGAYMEKERERAKVKGYRSPIQPDKASSDRDYDAALAFCIENFGQISLVSGSHNERSNIYLTELIEEKQINPKDENVYFAQLYGMSDNISYNLANAGFNVVKYVPYGPVEKVMPYLGRRAEENTSVAGQSSREFDLIKKEIARRRNLNK